MRRVCYNRPMHFLRFLSAAALACCLLASGGCASERFVVDAEHPEIVVDARGTVSYRGRSVDPDDLPAILRKSGLSRRDTIYISIPPDLKDYRMPYYVMGVLAKNGYPRPILVGARKASSEVSDGRKGGRKGAH